MINTIYMNVINIYVVKKAIAIKALILFAIPTSIVSTGLLSILMKDVEIKNIAIPTMAIIIGFIFYILFFLLDLRSGLLASKHEFMLEVKSSKRKKDDSWVLSSKLYRSMWKLLGVAMLHALFLFMTILPVFLGFNNTSIGILIISMFISILSSSYEFHSIGENIKRRTGYKPEIYTFIDKITSILETKTLNKIEQQ